MSKIVTSSAREFKRRSSRVPKDQRHSVLFRTQFSLTPDDIDNNISFSSRQTLMVTTSSGMGHSDDDDDDLELVKPVFQLSSSDTQKLDSESESTPNLPSSKNLDQFETASPVIVSTLIETPSHQKKESKEHIGRTMKLNKQSSQKFISHLCIESKEPIRERVIRKEKEKEQKEKEKEQKEKEKASETKKDSESEISENDNISTKEENQMIQLSRSENNDKPKPKLRLVVSESDTGRIVGTNKKKRKKNIYRNTMQTEKVNHSPKLSKRSSSKGDLRRSLDECRENDSDETESLSDDVDSPVMEKIDGIMYTKVEKGDLDVVISSDEQKLKNYLQRQRISVGFPIKGYKEALVLDIRNGDDNPFQQKREIKRIVNLRKKQFRAVHRDFTSRNVTYNELDKKGELVTKTVTIVQNIKEQAIDYEIEQINKLKITGFTSQKEYFDALTENEKEDFESYKNSLMELLFTEEAHVQSLDILLNCYLIPLRDGKYTSLLRKLCIQVDQLYKLHKLFYNKLSKRVNDAGDDIPVIGDILFYFFHFVKLTCPYIVEYNKNLRIINELVKRTTATLIIGESRKNYEEKNPGIVIQRIQSYLIMPIQRIPRYILLLKDMLKKCLPISPDTDKLVECYQVIIEVAAWINEKKSFEEEREKYNAVLTTITGLYDLNKTCRRFILSGFCNHLDIQELNGYTCSYFFLFNDMLIQTKLLKHHNHKIKSKQMDKLYKIINRYRSIDDFNNDLFQVEKVFMVTEDAVISYLPNCTKPSFSFLSPLSDMQVTMVFDDPLDANAWFIALAYTIKLSPTLNESKSIFNIRNE